jgi:hypothetical protein
MRFSQIYFILSLSSLFWLNVKITAFWDVWIFIRILTIFRTLTVPSWSFMAVSIKKSMSVMGDSCTMPFPRNFNGNLGGFPIAGTMILPMDRVNWRNMYEDYATIWNLYPSIKNANSNNENHCPCMYRLLWTRTSYEDEDGTFSQES